MRTKLRSRISLLFVALAALIAIPAVALADTITADPIVNTVVVDNNVSKAPGETGSAKVWLVNDDNATDPVNGCNATTDNPVSITLSSNDSDVTFDSSGTKANPASLTNCGSAAGKEIGYTVNSSATGPFPKTVTVTASGSGGRVTGGGTNQPAYTPDTFTVTITAPANTKPSTPGTPSGASPNQGAFTLNWAASTDDGNPAGSSVTYTLQHKDSDDADFSNVASGLSGNSYTFGGSNAAETEGTWTYRVQASDGSLSSDFSATSSAIVVDKSAPSQPSANFSKIAEDTVGGWYKDAVTVSYNGSTDPALLDTSAGSGVASYTAAQPFNTSGTHNYSGTATDNAGNESVARTGQVKVDTNIPTFGACPSGGPFTLNSGSQSVGPISASDTGESGVDGANSTLSGSVDTASIGTKTVTFTAQDNVGHSATQQCTYSVNYNWSDFFRPVDNGGVYNTVKAGQGIPMKFSLSGNQGLSIIAANFPTSVKVPCNALAPQDQVEETVTAGNSSLSYDSSIDQYNYVWKTDKAWAGTCRQFNMKLADGTTHTALFNFTK